MDPPDPGLATHLIRVTPCDVSRDGDYAMDPRYDTPFALENRRSYVGTVEAFGQSGGDDGIIYSVNGFDVTVFAADDPGIVSDQGVVDDEGKPLPTQSMLEWAKIPADFPLPMPGAAGPIDLPDGWRPEKVASAMADSNALDFGCWFTQAEARS
jgi:hypothetical protein